MLFLHRFLLIDPSLGRIDKQSLTTQTLMELLISTIERKNLIIKKDENLDRFESWDGVITHDGGFKITWGLKRFGGSMNFQWLPDCLLRFNVSSNNLEWTADFSNLQDSALERLEIALNSFTGTLDLTHLPPRLQYLDFAKNSLEGTMDLTHLPSTLTQLLGYKNKFSGSLCLEHLPISLHTLSISENNFEGSISLQNLPKELNGIFIASCQLSGSLDLTQLPNSVERMYMYKNNFSGELKIGNLKTEGVHIQLEKNPLLEGTMRLTKKQHVRITVGGTNVQREYTESDGL